MEKDNCKTEVIFRMWKGAEIALFPYEVNNIFDNSIMSYMKVGQHGGADYNHIIRSSKHINNPEDTDLYKELVREYGYDFKVIKRRNHNKYLSILNNIRNAK